MFELEYICKFCGKLCKNKKSLSQHEIRCPKNPDKINTCNEGFNNKGRDAWNKGITGRKHNAETIEKIRVSALKAKEKLHKTQEYQDYRQRMSELAKSRQLGGFHFRRGIYYNGIKLDSSYEVAVAESLDTNNVLWERCKRFPYYDNEHSLHYYTPDFYLPEYDVYLDPKNDYLIENGQLGFTYTDKEKINWVCEQNNIVVLILDKHNLSWNKIKEKISSISSKVK